MQCHNYISDVYNKPNRLKIGRKMSKLWLFKSTCTIEVVSEYTVARWPPRADVDLHWPTARTRYLVFIYISMGWAAATELCEPSWLICEAMAPSCGRTHNVRERGLDTPNGRTTGRSLAFGAAFLGRHKLKASTRNHNTSRPVRPC